MLLVPGSGPPLSRTFAVVFRRIHWCLHEIALGSVSLEGFDFRPVDLRGLPPGVVILTNVYGGPFGSIEWSELNNSKNVGPFSDPWT